MLAEPLIAIQVVPYCWSASAACRADSLRGVAVPSVRPDGRELTASAKSRPQPDVILLADGLVVFVEAKTGAAKQ